jgi:hypothetical protein
MGFFDDDEQPSEPVDHRIPDWMRPPTRMVGKPISNTLTVIHNDDLAVVFTRFVAYPDGLDWDVSVRFARHEPSFRHQLAWEGHGRARFGIRCADGTAVHAYDNHEWPPKGRPEGPVLRQYSGQGDADGTTMSLWLTPLPSDPFHVIVAWKSGGIDETKTLVDIPNLAEAAAETLILWPLS